MKQSAKSDNSLVRDFPAIASEWDYEANDYHRPEEFKANSIYRAHWICPKGHHYEKPIRDRTRTNSRCPICSGKVVISGINDLGTACTYLMEEWDFDRNYLIFPSEVSAMSNRKVWWKCKNCGHIWRASIANRSRGSGCPNCRYRRSVTTRLQTMAQKNGAFGEQFPELLEEWDYAKNANLVDPMKTISNSHLKVWWKCKKCGYSWNASIFNRTHGWKPCKNCHGTSYTQKSSHHKTSRQIK